MFKTILVPTDGSPLSLRAAQAAIELAKAGPSVLVALAVAEPLPDAIGVDTDTEAGPGIDGRALLALAQQRADTVAGLAEAAGVRCRTSIALSYHPADEILQAAASHRCDLIFMASHGRRGLSKLFLGSQTQKVLAQATMPVMVFKEDRGPEGDAGYPSGAG